MEFEMARAFNPIFPGELFKTQMGDWTIEAGPGYIIQSKTELSFAKVL